MDVDVDKLSIEEKAAVAERARRNVRSEAVAIASAGGAALAVLLFVLGFPGLTFVGGLLGISEIAAWLVMSFGTSIALALIHRSMSIPKIDAAKRIDAQVHIAEERARRAAADAKIAAMNAGPSN